jgi:hypothetical protein
MSETGAAKKKTTAAQSEARRDEVRRDLEETFTRRELSILDASIMEMIKRECDPPTDSKNQQQPEQLEARVRQALIFSWRAAITTKRMLTMGPEALLLDTFFDLFGDDERAA